MSDEEDAESESGDETEDVKETEEEDEEEEEEQATTAGKGKVEEAPKKENKKKEEEEEAEDEEDEDDQQEEEDMLKSLNIGKECINILRNAFIAFDQEKRGVLGTEMIGIILELLGHSLTPAELDEIIREVDADGSGELEFEEFVLLASKFLPEDSDDDENPEQTKKQLKEAFRFYDREGNGFITVDAFKSILQELDPDIPQSEVDGMVNEIDQDDSGTVDFDEFMNAMGLQ